DCFIGEYGRRRGWVSWSPSLLRRVFMPLHRGDDSDYSDFLERGTSMESEQYRGIRENPNNPNLPKRELQRVLQRVATPPSASLLWTRCVSPPRQRRAVRSTPQ